VIANLRADAVQDLQKVKDAINKVYTNVVVETEADVTVATTTVTAGTNSYTLPAGISRIKSMFVTPTGGQASRPLRRMTLDQMIALRSANAGPNANNGTVNAYCILGLNEFEVYPTPQSADTLTIYYSIRPTPLAADTDVPILPEPYATECLVDGASADVAKFTGDPDMSWYQQLADDSKARLRTHLNRLTGRVTGQFNIQDDKLWPAHDPSVDIRDWSN
jgi:hypothetical protein